MTDDESLIAALEAHDAYLADIAEPESEPCSECEEACDETGMCYRCQCALQVLDLY